MSRPYFNGLILNLPQGYRIDAINRVSTGGERRAAPKFFLVLRDL
jgi:hypothetical protein